MQQENTPHPTTLATDFLQRLKRDTGDLHRHLESNPVAAALMQPQVSPADYARYLAAMQGVVGFVENEVFPTVAPYVGDIGVRRKLPLLLTDRISVDGGRTHAAPFNIPLPGTDQAMGAMYVLEGSILGGKVIQKHLRQCLGEELPYLFFDGYGEHTGRRWKMFLSDLSQYASTPLRQDGVVDGAQRMFLAIDQHFTEMAPK